MVGGPLSSKVKEQTAKGRSLEVLEEEEKEEMAHEKVDKLIFKWVGCNYCEWDRVKWSLFVTPRDKEH